MVILEEEEGAKPEEIAFVVVDRDTICGYVTDIHPPPVDSWNAKKNKLIPTVDKPRTTAILTCPDDKVVHKVEYASYGESTGICGGYFHGSCTAPASKQVVEKVKMSCFQNQNFDK